MTRLQIDSIVLAKGYTVWIVNDEASVSMPHKIGKLYVVELHEFS